MSEEAVAVLRADQTLAPLIRMHGVLSLEPTENDFQRLVTSIIRQQVSVAAATAIRKRVFDQFEITPAALARTDPDELRSAGLSRQKAEYVRNTAIAFLEHGYGYDYFVEIADQMVLDELTSIRGLGIWTGKMYLIFCLAREDVFPVEDLGIRNGMKRLYGKQVTQSDMLEIAERWRPYRSIASLYLWRSVDD